MIWNIPRGLDVDSFVQETLLDGTTYRLLFRWNAREEFWYLTVKDTTDVVLIGSRKLVPGADLLRHIVENRPPGNVLVIGTPDQTTLGTDATVNYVEESGVV